MAEATTSYALMATYHSATDVYHAAEKVRDAGYRRWDVISPFPIHGLDAAMGLPRSKVPLFTFVGGITGFTTGMLLTWYTGEFEYPLIVGGKPFWDSVFPFPIFYELTILLAAFGTLGGMFLTNLLPQHHHPVMNHDKWVQFMDDKFAIVIELSDPKFDATATRALLAQTGGAEITEVSA